jgi:hypothetical protein
MLVRSYYLVYERDGEKTQDAWKGEGHSIGPMKTREIAKIERSLESGGIIRILGQALWKRVRPRAGLGANRERSPALKRLAGV